MKKLFFSLLFLLLGLTGTQAQEQTRIARVGVLIPESLPSESQTIKGLRERLKELGYQEGKNIQVEIRDAEGDRGALKEGAYDLVTKPFDADHLRIVIEKVLERQKTPNDTEAKR